MPKIDMKLFVFTIIQGLCVNWLSAVLITTTPAEKDFNCISQGLIPVVVTTKAPCI